MIISDNIVDIVTDNLLIDNPLKKPLCIFGWRVVVDHDIGIISVMGNIVREKNTIVHLNLIIIYWIWDPSYLLYPEQFTRVRYN